MRAQAGSEKSPYFTSQTSQTWIHAVFVIPKIKVSVPCAVRSLSSIKAFNEILKGDE